MKKTLIALFCGFSISWAGLVNGIAMVVNNEPITLYDIDQEMQSKNVDKKQAIKNLINAVVYDQEIKKNNVSVDIFDVDNYIAKLAAQNNMKPLEFKSLIRQQRDYNSFLDSIKKQLIHQKLIRKVAGGKIKIATDEDLKIYYENNQEQFRVADSIETTVYVSKDKRVLQEIVSNPMLKDNRVASQDISFKDNELNPQVKYVLQSTKEGEFSPIFVQNKNYNMFYVKKKVGEKLVPFEEVKEQVFQIVMEQRETNFLNEYFETQKLTSTIKVYR
jgi:ribosomal protein L25 (general stress protein Ctc)